MQAQDLVALRKRLKWSQQDLADRLELSLRTIQQMEAGAKRLTAIQTKAIQQLAAENPSTPDSRQLKMELDFQGLIRILASHLYSKKEIFVRELIQNAHDATWRRHHADPHFDVGQGRIDIVTDMTSGAGRLVFRDNGIGMSDEDLVEHLSAIGRSGTRAAQGEAPEVIGQFGIGFLSGFVVAGRIEVRTRHFLARPEQGCLWTSDGDQDYSISPTTLDRVGTEVTIYLRDATDRGVLHEDTLRKVITTYADMLKVPIHLNDPQHIRPPANMRIMPWEREGLSEQERRLENTIYLEKLVPDSVLEVIPVNEEDVQGLLYISKTRVLGAPAPRTVRVFLKRMFLCENADDLLPRWASFVNGLLNTTALEPNAARDKYMEDEKFVALRERLGKIIIAHLEALKVKDPDRLSDIMAYHDFAIKAACHYYGGFYQQFGHLLQWRINPGSPLLNTVNSYEPADPDLMTGGKRMTLPDIVKALPVPADGGPKRLSCFTSLSSTQQYYDMADAAATTVVDASFVFEGELLKAWATANDTEVTLIHVDRQDDPAVFREVDLRHDAGVRELAQYMSAAITSGSARLRVEARRFSPAGVAAVLRDGELTESLQKAQSMINDPTVPASLKRMAEDVVRMNRLADVRMFINAENDLVRGLADLVLQDRHNEDILEIALGVYNSAILANARAMDPANAKKFSEQYQRLVKRILAFTGRSEMLKRQEEDLARRVAEAQPRSPSSRRHLQGFHITRFAPEFDDIREMMRSILEDDFNCELLSADQRKLQPWISQNAREHIADADFFIVDLSDPISPNVLIEAGAIGYGRPDAPAFYIGEVENSGDKVKLPVDIEGLIVHPYVRGASREERRAALVSALKTDVAFEALRSGPGREPYISPGALDRQTANIVSSIDARFALTRAFPTQSAWSEADAADVAAVLRPYALEPVATAVQKLMTTPRSL